MASNENPLGCSPKASEAVRQWAANMALYPDGSCYDLSKMVASKIGVLQDNLLFGAGSDQILEMISQSYLNPDDEAIMPIPSFPRYETVTRIMSAKPVELKLSSDHRLDVDAYLAAVTDKTKVVWICNPNNPTGTIITKSEQQRLLDGIPGTALIVLDEAYYEYVTSSDYPESIKLIDTHPNIVILRTFSKAYGLAGLRVGYAIAQKEIIQSLNKVRAPFNVNSAAQVAALAALSDDEFITESVSNNIQGIDYLCREFNFMGLEFIPTHTNFIMVNLNVDTKSIFTSLQREGVIVRPGQPFGMPNWIRLTIGKPDENEKFINSLKKVLEKRCD